MPVRVDIQASLVSKKVARSSLLTVSDGNALPVPMIFICFSNKNFAAKEDRSNHIKRKRWLLWAKSGEKASFGTKYPDFWDENRGICEKSDGIRDEKG